MIEALFHAENEPITTATGSRSAPPAVRYVDLHHQQNDSVSFMWIMNDTKTNKKMQNNQPTRSDVFFLCYNKEQDKN